MTKHISRRGLLAGVAATGGALALPSILRQAHSAPDPDKPARFLIVLGMFGGASIIDSMLPFTHSESPNPDIVNCFPDANVIQPPGSNIRTVDWSGNLFGAYSTNLSSFVAKHHSDMLVATVTGTSVNHTVAQKRSITGNGAWNGRSLQEALAQDVGGACPIPNVNMSSNGFAQHGDDVSLPSYAYMEPVSVPALWPFALHGSRGVKITEGTQAIDGPDPALLELARELRNEKLDPESSFFTTFQLNEKLQRWKDQRNVVQPKLEQADLITKLNMLSESAGLPFAKYGLASSPDAAAVQAAFPALDHDPLQAQAALAYLLIKNRVSVSVTIGPNFNLVLGNQALGEPLLLNPPLSFDNSHTAHRDTQAVMWQRTLNIIDSLITLLKGVELEPGVSFWDRTMIYCATDFGRDKKRENSSVNYGTGHELNNGILAISPLVKGNTVLGGVNTTTGMTYGFNPTTGAPDVNREMSEGEIYAGLTQALGIDTGLPDMSAMVG
jgi:hypothetical protein